MFWEKFWGFCGFAKFFGLGFVKMISHVHALHSMFIITMFHAFQDYVTDYTV